MIWVHDALVLQALLFGTESDRPSDEAVHAVNSKVTKKKVYSHKKVKSSSSAGSCGNCGSEHAPRQCKAYGLKCHKCGKYNHFQKCCRSKVRATAHMVGETESQTESDSGDSLSYASKWNAVTEN